MNGRSFASLAKNRTAFEVVRLAIKEGGLSPEKILAQTKEGRRRRRRPILFSSKGTLSRDEMTRRVALWGSTNPGRYYLSDDDLFYVDGQTWALTNQWSGKEVEEFIDELIVLCPALDVTYTVG